MKKIMAIFTLFLILGLSPALAQKFKVGSHANYYFPKDPVYKKVYEEGGPMFGGFLIYKLRENIEIIVEVGSFQKKGRTTITEKEVKFTLTPIVLGMRVRMINTKILEVYGGGGVVFCFFTEKLPEEYFEEDVAESGIGFRFESGSYFHLSRILSININLWYLKLDVKPFDRTVNLGAFGGGIGLVLRF
jgi:hypothetical protein